MIEKETFQEQEGQGATGMVDVEGNVLDGSVEDYVLDFSAPPTPPQC